MEDALAPAVKLSVTPVTESLNPCFNGRCTRTIVETKIGENKICLNPCFNGRCTRTIKDIVNLVLGSLCLNPCFNGRCTRTEKVWL